MKGLREIIKQNSKIAAFVFASVTVVAVGISLRSPSSPAYHGLPTKAFYSTDDGKTWFVDDANKLTPFETDGKDAVLAHVYESNGNKFVAYLERMSKAGREAQQQLLELEAKAPPSVGGGGPPGDILRLAEEAKEGIEYKRPGENTWVARRPVVAASPNDDADAGPVFP